MKKLKKYIRLSLTFLSAMLGVSFHYAIHHYGDVFVTYLHRPGAASESGAAYAAVIKAPPLTLGEFTAFIPTITRHRKTARMMASGKKTYKGAIACPSWVELGTRIEVENIGVFTCEDRMAKEYRYTENFDILVLDYDEAMEFGRQHLKYRIL